MEIIPKREEYLIAIFKLSQLDEKVTNKNLSEWLKITPPSVSEMIKKLKQEDYLIDNRSIELSEKGLSTVKTVLSKHRLWEYFLTEVLKYNWKDVHDNAELFQSVTNDELFNKLNEYLGYPEYCPHGSVIYFNNEEKNSDLILFSDAKVGKEYIVRRIKDDRGLLEYMEKTGVKIGQKIKILEFDDFDGAVKIEFLDKIVNISSKATNDVFLKEINSEKK